jgi:hypothetical protein
LTAGNRFSDESAMDTTTRFTPRLPAALQRTALRHGIRASRFILSVSVATQTMSLFEQVRGPRTEARFPRYAFCRRFVISTSRFGIGQILNSNQTPLGLHRIARKAGGGHPIGTIFKGRRPVGLTWQGQPDGAIVHRILWLEGLEPGFNRGGNVDTFQRYVYIHGFGDETTLGRPQSCGCIHLSAADLMPLYDQLPVGTLVWIGER